MDESNPFLQVCGGWPGEWLPATQDPFRRPRVTTTGVHREGRKPSAGQRGGASESNQDRPGRPAGARLEWLNLGGPVAEGRQTVVNPIRRHDGHKHAVLPQQSCADGQPVAQLSSASALPARQCPAGIRRGRARVIPLPGRIRRDAIKARPIGGRQRAEQIAGVHAPFSDSVPGGVTPRKFRKMRFNLKTVNTEPGDPGSQAQSNRPDSAAGIQDPHTESGWNR